MSSGRSGNLQPDRLLTDAGSPPWIWVWAATIVVYTFRLALPQISEAWQGLKRPLPFVFPSVPLETAVRGFRVLLTGLDLLSVVSPCVILALLAVAALQCRRVRQRYGLNPSCGQLPDSLIAAITETLPGAEIGTNRRRPYPLLFVYPVGWRRCGIAILSSFLVLWKRDRDAGRALLEHEAVHQRRGDAQLIGAGKFQRVVLLVTGVWLISTFLSMVGMATWQEYYVARFRNDPENNPYWKPVAEKADVSGFSYNAFMGYSMREWRVAFERWEAQKKEEPADLGRKQGDEEGARALVLSDQEQRWKNAGNWNARGIAGWLATLLGQFAYKCGETCARLMFLVAAVWAAELQADRQASLTLKGSDAISRSHTLMASTGGWAGRAASCFTHPPAALRRWLGAAPQSRLRLVALLLVYPACHYLFFIPISAGVLVKTGCDEVARSLLLDDSPADTSLSLLFRVLAGGLQSQVWLVGLEMCVILAWPVLCPHWERMFSGSTRVACCARYLDYVLAAGCLVLMLGISEAIQRILTAS